MSARALTVRAPLLPPASLAFSTAIQTASVLVGRTPLHDLAYATIRAYSTEVGAGPQSAERLIEPHGGDGDGIVGKLTRPSQFV